MAIAGFALLIPVQLGWITALSSAWGFNLWQYQPPAFAGLLCVALLALVFSRTRQWLIDGIERAEQFVTGALGRRNAVGLLLFVVTVSLWLMRERHFFGDSTILVYSATSGAKFAFPELGASFLLAWSLRIAHLVGTPGVGVYQILMCICGATAVGCFLGLGRSLAPQGSRGALFAALVLCGGVLRIFAGHVEVYGFVIAAAAAYLWASAAFLRGRCGYALPALAFGVGLWLHLSFAFLAPSLALLPGLDPTGTSAPKYAKQLAIAFAAGAAPMSLFVLSMLLVGNAADLQTAWSSVVSAAGASTYTGVAEGGRELWVRGWNESPGAGTRYTMLSGPHLKYLANSFFLLAPAAVPLLLFFAAAPKRFTASPQAVFLSVAALSTVAYCVILRPIWGPYDWDLFSLTAVCLATLAAFLLVDRFEQPLLAHLVLVLVAGSLFLATIPLLLAGVSTPRDAGPFSDTGIASVGDETPEQAFDRQIGPWL